MNAIDLHELASALAPLVSAPRTPTLALTVEQACEALSVSWDTWNAHIAPDVRIVRIGRRKLIAVAELCRWLDAHGESAREAA
jgi:hypothetical protein